jgi:GNAT superfamily N-acetyltransferase
MSGETLATLIRPRRPGDGQGLAQVWLDTARYYAELDPERFQVPDARGLADWFEERLAAPTGDDQFDRVADVDGQVVGLVHAAIMEAIDSAPRQLLRELAWRRLMVNALAVHSAFWRRGIGRQLLEAAENWGQGRGARAVSLDTYIHSDVSVPFYEHGMGYRRQSLVFSKALTRLADSSVAAAHP